MLDRFSYILTYFYSLPKHTKPGIWCGLSAYHATPFYNLLRFVTMLRMESSWGFQSWVMDRATWRFQTFWGVKLQEICGWGLGLIWKWNAYITPPKIHECHLKRDHFKRKIVFQPVFFRYILVVFLRSNYNLYIPTKAEHQELSKTKQPIFYPSYFLSSCPPPPILVVLSWPLETPSRLSLLSTRWMNIKAVQHRNIRCKRCHVHNVVKV